MEFIWYLLAGAALVYSIFCLIRHLRGKSAPSPILMILLSAGLGIVFYSFM